MCVSTVGWCNVVSAHSNAHAVRATDSNRDKGKQNVFKNKIKIKI